MKLRYILLVFSLFVLSGCTDAINQNSYTVPTAQREIAPIERRVEVDSNDVEIQQTPSTVKETETVPLSNDNYYINSQGNEVHSPANAPSIPPGASARCADGTYSFSQSRRGTCSHHGGVAEWY
jgi:hypothetical protein